MTVGVNSLNAIVQPSHYEFIVTVPKFIIEGNTGWVEHPVASFENEGSAIEFCKQYNSKI